MNIKAMKRNFQEIEDIVKSIEVRYIRGFDMTTYSMLISKEYIKVDNSDNLQVRNQDGEYIYVTASALMTYISRYKKRNYKAQLQTSSKHYSGIPK